MRPLRNLQDDDPTISLKVSDKYCALTTGKILFLPSSAAHGRAYVKCKYIYETVCVNFRFFLLLVREPAGLWGSS